MDKSERYKHELHLIGAILFDKENSCVINCMLAPEDFQNIFLQVIYIALLEPSLYTYVGEYSDDFYSLVAINARRIMRTRPEYRNYPLLDIKDIAEMCLGAVRFFLRSPVKVEDIANIIYDDCKNIKQEYYKNCLESWTQFKDNLTND